MNIVLIGYRCSGKTAVGKILARELGRDFLDTDELIEREIGDSIQGFVSKKGWDHFREMEKSIIKKIAKIPSKAQAMGGPPWRMPRPMPRTAPIAQMIFKFSIA